MCAPASTSHHTLSQRAQVRAPTRALRLRGVRWRTLPRAAPFASPQGTRSDAAVTASQRAAPAASTRAPKRRGAGGAGCATARARGRTRAAAADQAQRAARLRAQHRRRRRESGDPGGHAHGGSGSRACRCSPRRRRDSASCADAPAAREHHCGAHAGSRPPSPLTAAAGARSRLLCAAAVCKRGSACRMTFMAALRLSSARFEAVTSPAADGRKLQRCERSARAGEFTAATPKLAAAGGSVFSSTMMRGIDNGHSMGSVGKRHALPGRAGAPGESAALNAPFFGRFKAMCAAGSAVGDRSAARHAPGTRRGRADVARSSLEWPLRFDTGASRAKNVLQRVAAWVSCAAPRRPAEAGRRGAAGAVGTLTNALCRS